MRPLLIPIVLSAICTNADIFAQPAVDMEVSPAPVAIPSLASANYLDRLLSTMEFPDLLSPGRDLLAPVEVHTTQPAGWRKKITIESFGYSLKTPDLGYDSSPAYTAALYNLHGLECPRCLLGPVNRVRFTLPPFGATATARLRDGRVELFTGFGALEAWKPDGTLERQGLRLGTSSEGDAWLAQVHAGGRVALDRGQRVWLGVTGRYLYNFGSGPQQWSTFSGNATFRLGH